MTADERRPGAAGAAELLQRGPLPVPRRSPRARARAIVRALLLRAARPQARHQREVDDAIVAALARLEAELELARERQEERLDRVEDLVRELILTSESLRRGIADSDSATDAAHEKIDGLTAELYEPPYVAENPFERMRAPVGAVVGFGARAGGNGGPPSDYVAFEEIFRGPAERVSESQRPYLLLVREHAPVLDVGCGRGEFLKLLADEGIESYGIDSDPGMVERCHALGARAELADAAEHLQGLPDGSLGTIFSAQVIEHLSYEQLRRMLELSLAKLRPGGLFIAETVNPHRLSSLKTFWVDLTHNQPIFPEVALAMCAIAGFESAYVFAPGFDDFDDARFKSPAYAVVATARSADG
jgi:2-polyprenyl-3-methyl-5-hydroxy-6-metoxy-1,4-benzoquinol methylase